MHSNIHKEFELKVQIGGGEWPSEDPVELNV